MFGNSKQFEQINKKLDVITNMAEIIQKAQEEQNKQVIDEINDESVLPIAEVEIELNKICDLLHKQGLANNTEMFNIALKFKKSPKKRYFIIKRLFDNNQLLREVLVNMKALFRLMGLQFPSSIVVEDFVTNASMLKDENDVE